MAAKKKRPRARAGNGEAVSVRRPTTVLTEAEAIVSGPRQQVYGHPRDNFECAAGMISAYLKKRGTIELDALDVAMIHILQKVARQAHSRKRDNIVDIAGYARTAELVAGGGQ